MPFNPRIIGTNTRDPGTAQRLVDMQRQLEQARSNGGYIGGGAAITGPLIETADSGQRVFLQGPLYGTSGLFCTDPSGNIVVSVIPGQGLILASGQNQWNQVEWRTGAASDAIIGTFPSSIVVGGTPHAGNNLQLAANSPDGSHQFEVSIDCFNGPVGNSVIYAMLGGMITKLCDGNGNAAFAGSVGQFGQNGPSSQPAKPTTLAGVISVLEAYGLCA